MSAVISGGCCCGTCTNTCESWWACSPTGPVNIVLSGTFERRLDIVEGGQTMVEEFHSWSITATLTRVGSSCSLAGGPPYNNLYRYTTNTADFSYQLVRRTHSVGRRHTCNVVPVCDPPFPLCCVGDMQCPGLLPSTGNLQQETFPGSGVYTCSGGPCGTYFDLRLFPACDSWNCKSSDDNDCGGVGPKALNLFEWRLLSESTFNYVGTISNATGGIAGGDPGSSALCPVGNLYYSLPMGVVTIYHLDVCGLDCPKPVLFVNADQITYTCQQIQDRSMDPCCPSCNDITSPPPGDPCYTETTSCVALPKPGFAISGDGPCFSLSSFFNPSTIECLLPPQASAVVFKYWVIGDGEASCTPINGNILESKYHVYNNPDTYDGGDGVLYYDRFCGSQEAFCDGTFVFTRAYWPDWTEKRTLTTNWLWTVIP